MITKNGLTKRIFQAICLLGFFTILFSCQGISLNKIVHADMTRFDHQEVNCCETGEGMHITPSHVESLFVFPALKFPLNLFVFISVLVLVVSFPVSQYDPHRGKEYIRSIRDRYGTPLNSFTHLFSQGLLHSKVF